MMFNRRHDEEIMKLTLDTEEISYSQDLMNLDWVDELFTPEKLKFSYME